MTSFDALNELLEPLDTTLAELETPVPVIDVDIAERNLVRWQMRCDALGIANRPHIKTHKLVYWARRQVELGATGISCQKLGEAEVMADAGFDDILICFNIVGDSKLARLAALARRARLSLVADSAFVVAGLARAAAAAETDLRVLVECDTGAGRCGVQTPAAAAELARSIAAAPGLTFAGLMTYPKAGTRTGAAAFLAEARGLCEDTGLPVAVISTGGTPDMWSDEGLGGVTEYRAGTYIYNDRSLVERGVCAEADCALTVLATVVSRPTAGRALVDAGSKALSSDLLGLKGHGIVRQWPTAAVAKLDEEHGYLDVSACDGGPQVGDRVNIIPNHVCVVTNLFDKVVLVRADQVLGQMKVDARGRVF